MPIKIGFNTSVCPDWDLDTIAQNAADMGFYGVELGSLRAKQHPAYAAAVANNGQAASIRQRFADRNVELVSLVTPETPDTFSRRVAAEASHRIAQTIEAAARLGCAYVRMPIGHPEGPGNHERLLSAMIEPLTRLAHHAARNRVTLLVCNTPELPSSRSLWFVIDGVSHPGLQAAWDPVLGLSTLEPSSIAVPRLGIRSRMIVACDAEFDDRGYFQSYKPIGEGTVDFAHTIDLLKGVMFNGYLMLDWPRRLFEELPPPQQALPAALDCLLERIKQVGSELTAYKKDKNAPNYAKAGKAYVERQTAKTNDTTEEAGQEVEPS
jgi:sugar phosphate isomerase/epimerase